MDYPKELERKFLYTEDAANVQQNNGTIVQRGAYVLASGKADITFPVSYLTLSPTPTSAVTILVTPRGATQFQYVQSVALGTVLFNGATPVSGFTVSGSGTEFGSWLSVGYR